MIKEAEGIKKQDVGQEIIRMAVLDLQEVQDNYTAIDAIAQDRALRADNVRDAFARVFRGALEEANQSSDAVRRALNSTETAKRLIFN